MLRVCVVDDFSIVHEGLEKILGGTDMEIVCSIHSGLQFDADLRKNLEWDIVILDISLPDRSGLKILRQLRAVRPELPVLIFSMHHEMSTIQEAKDLGANGIISKGSSSQEIIKAIREIMKGRRYFLVGLEESANAAKGPHSALSRREYEVFLKLAQGKTNSRIGKDLGIHAKTVSSFRSRILEKLNLKSNSELIHYAIERQLVPLGSRSPRKVILRNVEAEPIAAANFGHIAQFYHSDSYLMGALTEFVRKSLAANAGVVLISTAAHYKQLIEELPNLVPPAVESGRITYLNAEQTLPSLMDQSRPSRTKFNAMLGAIVDKLKLRFSQINCYSELVDLLCAAGQVGAALQLEGFWNDFLAAEPNISLMCGYCMNSLVKNNLQDDMTMVAQTHGEVLPAEMMVGSQAHESLIKNIGRLKFKLIEMKTRNK